MAEAKGGETFISKIPSFKIPSFKITDLAQAMLPECSMPEVGIREGEKLHEVMITKEDSVLIYEYDKHYIIYPHYTWWKDNRIIQGGKRVEPGFEYNSGTNSKFLTVEEIKLLISNMKN